MTIKGDTDAALLQIQLIYATFKTYIQNINRECWIMIDANNTQPDATS